MFSVIGLERKDYLDLLSFARHCIAHCRVMFRFVESRGQVPAGSCGQRGRRCDLQVQRVSVC